MGVDLGADLRVKTILGLAENGNPCRIVDFFTQKSSYASKDATDEFCHPAEAPVDTNRRAEIAWASQCRRKVVQPD